jgi:hypothetical protein
MHFIKIVNASQARSIYTYMNTKIKLLNCNANIYFNKRCLGTEINMYDNGCCVLTE